MEKAAQTPNGFPHRRRRRRPTGSDSAQQAQQTAREGKPLAQLRKPAPQGTAPAAAKAPRGENPPRGNNRPRRGQGKPAAPQQAAPKAVPAKAATPAVRPAAPQNARGAAAQPLHRGGRPAPQTPSRPLPDQPKTPRQPRGARAQRRMPEDEPGLELIARRPPKQKFANFEDYLAAHGGMTVPLPEEPETAEAPAAPAAE